MSKMRDLPQTQKAKKQYYSPIIDLLLKPDGTKSTREELQEKLNCSDREVRRIVAECSCYYPILATSDGAGYRRARDIESLTNEELAKDYDDVVHTIQEIRARIDCLKKKLKPLIAWERMAEKLRGCGNNEDRS